MEKREKQNEIRNENQLTAYKSKGRAQLTVILYSEGDTSISYLAALLYQYLGPTSLGT